MTVIENINIAYVSQDLSLLSSADADGTKDLRYLSVFAIGCGGGSSRSSSNSSSESV